MGCTSDFAKPTLDRRQAQFQVYAARTRQRLYHFARRTLGNPQDAEDITQETLARAWAHFDDFDPQRSFEAWALRIASNLMIDQNRRRRRRQEISLEASVDHLEGNESVCSAALSSGPGDPQDLLLTRESNAELMSTLRSLPSIHQTTLLMIAQEHSYEQIARTLDCPVGTVRSRVHRARVMLRRSLKESTHCE